MKFEVYDKAKWHYDSKDMPKDLPAIAGATHIAFFNVTRNRRRLCRRAPTN